ncbi:uncharacterized protein PV09_08426 [Verruconis gallopava]|uniref:NmrA-like domain-containing protein n=1 Tax=Verruconis gallopava TaxID=253628 RepID=A0A0D2ALU5_9PEZI|nr:uncharacterized protein PV09_08426 [Verruconis gallopava]KIW00084.1 hypothetical protein PV09_08426 [Verruconis gallopava]
MTRSIQGVIVLGASGDVGREVVNALLRDHFRVTVGVRDGSSRSTSLPASVRTTVIDYNSQESLERAFRGHDAIVETFNPTVAVHQDTIVQAAIAAKVIHLITPDFSTDTFNENADELMIFEPKLNAQRVLEVYAATGAIQWTAVITGPFFDWGILKKVFWVDKDTKEVIIFGSGDQKVSMSAIDMSGRAVVAILREPQKFSNRAAYFADYTVSNNELLALLRDIDPKGEWKSKNIPISSFFSQAKQLWEQDTKAGVKDRLNSTAYQMLGTYGLFEEG